MKINKKSLILFAILLAIFLIVLIGRASAEVQTLGTFKQNSCVNLVQTCANCTYNNISFVSFPDSTQALGEVEMTQYGSSYNYTFCNATVLGSYIVNGYGNPDGSKVIWAYDFLITPSGADPISSGQSTVLLIALIVILSITIMFYILGFKTQNTAAMITFFTFAGIFTLILVLFTILMLNETLATSPTLVNGFENFYFVIGILAGVGILVLIIVVALIMLRAWKLKRGLID